MRKLKAALLGGAMMFGALTGAHAGETRHWTTTANNWSVDVHDDGRCSVDRRYPHGTRVMFGWRGNGIWIGIGNPDWKAEIVNDKVYPITMLTDGKSWKPVNYYGYISNGDGALLSQDTFSPEFIGALAAGNHFEIQVIPGTLLARVSLDGSAVAIDQLLECQKAQDGQRKVTPPSNNSVNNDGPWSVPVQRQGANVTLSVRLNDGEKLTFMLDTGATAIGIPQDLADRLGLKAIRWINVKYGDGSSGQEAVVMLDKVALNGVMLRNIEATVGPKGSPLLLGKNFLDRFGSYAIDNRQSVLILSK